VRSRWPLEHVFGRHRAENPRHLGVYKREAGMGAARVDRVQSLARAFEENDGRRPRILVAKVGQDGHDRGQKVIASAFAIWASTSTSGRCLPRPTRWRARRSKTMCISSASRRSPPAT